MLRFQALSPALLNDYLAFFDHDAFADNPEWAGCYCACFHVPTAEEWDRATPEENRGRICHLVQEGTHEGWLAYDGERPVGFCLAAPRAALPFARLRMGLPRDEAAGVGVLLCFVVAAGHRRQGVARGLLNAACEGFAARGLHRVEAYAKPEAEGDAAHFQGPPQMYLDAGFSEIGRFGGRIVLQKTLR